MPNPYIKVEIRGVIILNKSSVWETIDASIDSWNKPWVWHVDEAANVPITSALDVTWDELNDKNY